MSRRLTTWSVWWADPDPTSDREQAGRRPVLIVSTTFHLSLTGAALVTVLPLTTTDRGWLHHIQVELGNGKVSFVMTEQVRTISRDRLTSQISRLDAESVAQVRDALSQMID